MGRREEINVDGVRSVSDATPGATQNLSLKPGHEDMKSSILLPFSLTFQSSPFTAKCLMYQILIPLLWVWMQGTAPAIQTSLGKIRDLLAQLQRKTKDYGKGRDAAQFYDSWSLQIITKIIF